MVDDSCRPVGVRGQVIWARAGASPGELEEELAVRAARTEATAEVAAALPASFGAKDPRPLLLVDVDGVVCPYADELADPAAHGLELTTVGYARAWFSDRIADRLQRLGASFQLVWCTAWEDQAAEFLAPLLRIPPLPVIHFDEPAPDEDGHWKWPAIEVFAGGRPFAWIDDELGRHDDARAARHPAPTLLVRIDGTCGLDEAHVAQLVAFAESVRAWDARAG
jgi:hypothetical protein